MGCIITIGHLKYYIGFASSPHQQSKFDAHISQLNLLNSHKHIKDAEMKTNQNLKLVGLKQHNNRKTLQTTNKWEDSNCKKGRVKRWKPEKDEEAATLGISAMSKEERAKGSH